MFDPYLTLQRRVDLYLREIEPFTKQLVRLEMTQVPSITMENGVIVKFELRWTPEAKLLADRLKEAIDFIRLQHFTKQEIICAFPRPTD